MTGFVVAFAGSVALWWLYFDQSADAAAQRIARSADPGRLGRSAYHFIHPVMVAGIIVAAAADEKVLSAPGATPSTASAWMILGGPALFLAGHAAFKFVVWGVVSWPRLAGIAVLALLGPGRRGDPGAGAGRLRGRPGHRRRRHRPPALAARPGEQSLAEAPGNLSP